MDSDFTGSAMLAHVIHIDFEIAVSGVNHHPVSNETAHSEVRTPIRVTRPH
jgi:hypothetical protein